jgi:hypothetical protein
VLSLLGLVPGEDIAHTDHDGPVLVHLTVCRDHVRRARLWLHGFQLPGDEVDTWGTELLMERWGQVSELLEGTPIYRPEPLAA